MLNMYYAKARFYDADNRRFAEMDPILDPSQYDLRQYVMEPMALGQYLYVRNNAVNWIDPLGKYYVYKNTDKDGKTYYRFVRQVWLDSFTQGLTGLSLQQLFGYAVAGSSMQDTLSVELETLYAQEIQAAKTALVATGPIGATLVAGYEVSQKAKSLFIDLPAALDVNKRDLALQDILKDAGISDESYSREFISALSTMDSFINDNAWIFNKIDSLNKKSPYQIGKAIAVGDFDTVKDAMLSYMQEFANYYKAQVMNEVLSGASEAYWLDYFENGGCMPDMEYSRVYKPSKNPWLPNLPIIKSVRSEASERLAAFTDKQFNNIKELYNIIKESAKGLFP